MKPQIIIVAGHSGSGKTTLAKAIADILGYDELGFSYAGRSLSTMKQGSDEFKQIEDYIYNCIVTAISRSECIVIDGLASKTIYKRLIEDGYTVTIIFLNTPQRDRIARIAEREGCSIIEANKIETSKEKGKSAAGLNYIINKADVVIDGRLKKKCVLKEALQFYQGLLDIDADDNQMN